MGNDTNLIIEKNGDKTQRIKIAERGNAVCLLWICCFRITDIARVYETLRCPVERALTQLKHGIEVLEKYFGPISELDDSLKKLEAVLEENRDSDLILDYHDQPYLLGRLLIHALVGFEGDIKFFYSEQEIREWGAIDSHGRITGELFALPQSNGVMTWIGAIKRICFAGGYSTQTLEEYDLGNGETFDWQRIRNHEPSYYLIGAFG